jgi:hypothetical protein
LSAPTATNQYPNRFRVVHPIRATIVERVMPDTAGETPILAVKKMGGIVLVILGLLLTAWGFSYGYTWLGILGVLVLVGGAVLLALKVIRRNPP